MSILPRSPKTQTDRHSIDLDLFCGKRSSFRTQGLLGNKILQCAVKNQKGRFDMYGGSEGL